MGGILMPRALTRQPQQAVALNRAALPGLRMAYTPGLAPGATIGSGAAINIGRAGRQWYASAGGNTESSYIPFAPVTSSEWTFFVLGSTGSRAGFEVFADFNDGAPAATNRISISRSAYGSANVGSDARPYSPDYNGNVYLAENAPPTLIVLTISAKANQLCLYVDGQLAGTSTLSSTSAVTLSMLQLFSKGGYNSGGDWLNAGSAVTLAGLCDRAITPNEVAKLRANPWMVYASTPLLDGPVMAALMAPASGGTAGQLAGSAVAVATGTGALYTSVKLSGAAAAAATATGMLTTSIPLTASAGGQSAASGTLTTAIKFAGGTMAQAGATGALWTSVQLAGAAAARATISGDLAGAVAALAGAAAMQASATGSLASSIRLTGAAVAQGGVTGGLSTAIPLSGAALTQSSTSGSLAAAGAALVGNVVAQADTAGTLSTSIRLAGVAVVQTSASAQLAGSGVGLAGSSIAVASVQASLSTAIHLDGVASARSGAAGSLTTRLQLSGDAVCYVSMQGGLTVGIVYARAPVGTGYAPQQHYNERRPASTSSPRPAATQRNFR